jgi:hypothetical protein
MPSQIQQAYRSADALGELSYHAVQRVKVKESHVPSDVLRYPSSHPHSFKRPPAWAEDRPHLAWGGPTARDTAYR